MGKKTIFATRLTDATMGDLVTLAEQANQSISQKAEALLADAIRREKVVGQLFEEDYRHFDAVMKDSIPPDFTSEKDVVAWRDRSTANCVELGTQWAAKVCEHAEMLLSLIEGDRVQSSVDAVRTEAIASPPMAGRAPRKRQLDID